MLTLTLRVVSAEGATGPEVTATIGKATPVVNVTTSSAAPSPTRVSPIPFTISFAQPVTGFEIADIVVSNGTPGNLRTGDNITWTVEVTPAGPGPVELQVPALVAVSVDRPNGASNVTRVEFDTSPPPNQAVAFLGPVNLANQNAAGIEVSGGEAGAPYTLSITSSGGGPAVTRSSTLTSAGPQVIDLDLSGLPDGTLTVSFTLTGQSGPPATATVVKDTLPPTIISVTATGPTP
jgi:hypothetical protein